MNGRPRGFGLRLLMAAIIAVALALPGFGTSKVAHAQRAEVPADVAALLPPNSRINTAQLADLRGAGTGEWVLFYTTPQSTPWEDAHLAIAVRESGGWSLVPVATFEFVAAAWLELLTVGGTMAVAFSAGVGAHSMEMIIARWDGQTFATIFEGFSNAPGLFAADLDGDGTPEVVNRWSPYCEAYAVSPRLITVHRWDGASYVDATGQYPTLIAEVTAEVREALANSGYWADVQWSPAGRACLELSLGYLAAASGDLDAARAACRRARAIDASWVELSVPDYCE